MIQRGEGLGMLDWVGMFLLDCVQVPSYGERGLLKRRLLKRRLVWSDLI